MFLAELFYWDEHAETRGLLQKLTLSVQKIERVLHLEFVYPNMRLDTFAQQKHSQSLLRWLENPNPPLARRLPTREDTAAPSERSVGVSAGAGEYTSTSTTLTSLSDGVAVTSLSPEAHNDNSNSSNNSNNNLTSTATTSRLSPPPNGTQCQPQHQPQRCS